MAELGHNAALVTSANEVEEAMFSPVCLLVCLFVNDFLTTILVVECWNFRGLITTLICGSDSFVKRQG